MSYLNQRNINFDNRRTIAKGLDPNFRYEFNSLLFLIRKKNNRSNYNENNIDIQLLKSQYLIDLSIYVSRYTGSNMQELVWDTELAQAARISIYLSMYPGIQGLTFRSWPGVQSWLRQLGYLSIYLYIQVYRF